MQKITDKEISKILSELSTKELEFFFTTITAYARYLLKKNLDMGMFIQSRRQLIEHFIEAEIKSKLLELKLIKKAEDAAKLFQLRAAIELYLRKRGAKKRKYISYNLFEQVFANLHNLLLDELRKRKSNRLNALSPLSILELEEIEDKPFTIVHDELLTPESLKSSYQVEDDIERFIDGAQALREQKNGNVDKNVN